MLIDGVAVDNTQWTPLLASANGVAAGKPTRAGWGRGLPGKGVASDYDKLSVKDGVVLVHRFAPAQAAGDGAAASTSASTSHAAPASGDFASKLRTARTQGAKAIIIVDDGDPGAKEAALPELVGTRSGADAGIIAIAATRALARQLDAAKTIELRVELVAKKVTTHNLIGKLRATSASGGRGPAIVIGAHLDHLGYGGAASLAPGRAIHPGADDNASGVAVMLEVARRLAASTAPRERDIYFVAFSAEEMGVLGSTYFVKHAGIKFAAMINMDMVGRMRANALTVLGADSAKEWQRLVTTVRGGKRYL
ncbi:MAG: M20/M25/M40 family metallo-hydrolase [Myxococcales bacterium]|nr:M20/M25/M40 family metallo-hydrolase [Myxococcales bacterium]